MMALALERREEPALQRTTTSLWSSRTEIESLAKSCAGLEATAEWMQKTSAEKLVYLQCQFINHQAT